MKQLLTYHISLDFKGKLSQKQLDKISDAIYASIEGELKEIRKDKMEDYGINAKIDDYNIQEDHQSTPNPSNDPPVPHRPETAGRPPDRPRLKLSDLIKKEAENIRQQEHE